MGSESGRDKVFHIYKCFFGKFFVDKTFMYLQKVFHLSSEDKISLLLVYQHADPNVDMKDGPVLSDN